MFADGMCNQACNNRECGHDGGALIPFGPNRGTFQQGDCTWDGNAGSGEAYDVCRPLHAPSFDPAFYTKKPANVTGDGRAIGTTAVEALAPIELRFKQMNPYAVSLDSSKGKWYIELNFNLSVRWRDSRYSRLPCERLMPGIITLAGGADMTSRRGKKTMVSGLMWFPMLFLNRASGSRAPLDYETVMDDDATGNTPTFAISTSTFNFAGQPAGVPWSGGIGPPDDPPAGQRSCRDCLAYTIAVQRKFEVAAPDFKKFPFDQQYFQFELSINQADIFSCSDITSELNITGESGRTNLRNLIGDEWIAFNMSAAHPSNQDGGACQPGEPCKATCIVTLQCRRDNVIFAIKQIAPSILLLYACLLCLYLSTEEHTGDRVNVIIVGILILMVNFQTDLGLGLITYLIWWDWFNLISMILLMAVLAICLYDHRLYHQGKNVHSKAFRTVWTRVLLLCITPVVLAGLLIDGINGDYPNPMSNPVGIVLMVGGSLVFAIVAHLYYKRLVTMAFAARVNAARRLREVDVADEKIFEKVMESIYNAFDADGDGYMNVEEVREMLKEAFPSMGVEHLNDFMKTAVESAPDPTDPKLRLSNFIDIMAHLLPKIREVCGDDINREESKGFLGMKKGGFFGRSKTNSTKEDDDAATSIQKRVRGRAARKEAEGGSGDPHDLPPPIPNPKPEPPPNSLALWA